MRSFALSVWPQAGPAATIAAPKLAFFRKPRRDIPRDDLSIEHWFEVTRLLSIAELRLGRWQGVNSASARRGVVSAQTQLPKAR